MELTAEQVSALEKIRSWVYFNNDPYLTLKGYAGTGKTTIIKTLIDGLNKSYVTTATTNKAAKVIAARCDTAPKTIHSLLRLKMQKKGSKKELVQVGKPSDLPNLIIVDEASMINKELFNIIDEFSTNSKFLFVGDHAQLPPINESVSKIFQLDNIVSLSKVMRHGGSILEAATFVREEMSLNNVVTATSLKQFENENFKVIDKADSLNIIQDIFTSKQSEENSDYARFLTYTNNNVEKINWFIRQSKGRKHRYKYEIGDVLMAKEPVMHIDDSEHIIINNSEECKVIDEQTINDEFQILKVQSELTNEINEIHVIIDKKYDDQIKKQIRAYAIAKNWKDFWALKDRYANIQFSYSMTTHKSQGSTFNHVFVNMSDIMINRKLEERNQLIYTALTRAADKVYIVK